ncbi:MAG: hypothetical protein IAE67_06160 [Candidatus Competibacteraceae bacterium]|nr:hypothetical protein [Candidatus Competibacteraceae bacterium]
MKHILYLFPLMIFTIQTVDAQKVKSSDVEYNRQQSVYLNAMAWNDWEVATQAVYQIISLKPDEAAWKDTLCMLYFSRGYYIQSLIIAEELLKSKPQHVEILEIAAMSYDRIGALKESLEKYQLLVQQQSTLFRLYQIMQIEYRLKRLGECLITAEKILAHSDVSKETVRINLNEQQYQNVPISAATYNVLGMVSLDLNQKEQAIRNFEQSLQIYPDFVLPQNNLSALQSEKK